MSVVRTCMYLLVLSVNFHLIVCKPLFGSWLWCDMFCDDDDDVSTSTTSTSTEDYFDFFDACDDCPTRRPPTVRPIFNNNNMPPFSFEIPPNIGMGVNVSNRNGTWVLGLSSRNSPATIPAPTVAATTAAATSAATGGTTAAPTTTKK